VYGSKLWMGQRRRTSGLRINNVGCLGRSVWQQQKFDVVNLVSTFAHPRTAASGINVSLVSAERCECKATVVLPDVTAKVPSLGSLIRKKTMNGQGHAAKRHSCDQTTAVEKRPNAASAQVEKRVDLRGKRVRKARERSIG
jgi:hypothetical protein